VLFEDFSLVTVFFVNDLDQSVIKDQKGAVFVVPARDAREEHSGTNNLSVEGARGAPAAEGG
jgi:hypothetical protein